MLTSSTLHTTTSTVISKPHSAYGKIVVIKRNGMDSASFDLNDTSYTFGRGMNCDVRIQLLSVCEEHCKISYSSNGHCAVLTNLSLMNCTLLNGKPIEGHVTLKHGDLITVVERSFRYEIIKSPIKQTTPIQAFKQTPIPGSKLIKQTTAEDAANGSSPSVHSPTVMKTPVKEEPQLINVTLSVPRSLAKASVTLDKESTQKSSPSKNKSIADESPLALSSPTIQETNIPSSPSSRSPVKDTFTIHDSAQSPIKLATTAPPEWKVEDNPFTVTTSLNSFKATPTKSSVIESSPIKAKSPDMSSREQKSTPTQSVTKTPRRTPEVVVMDHEIMASPKLSPQVVRVDSPLTREDDQEVEEENISNPMIVQEAVPLTESIIVEQSMTSNDDTIVPESLIKGTLLATQMDVEMLRMESPEKLSELQCEQIMQPCAEVESNHVDQPCITTTDVSGDQLLEIAMDQMELSHQQSSCSPVVVTHQETKEVNTNIADDANLHSMGDSIQTEIKDSNVIANIELDKPTEHVAIDESQSYSQDFSEPPPFSQDSPHVASSHSTPKTINKTVTPRTSAQKLNSITKLASKSEFTSTPSKGVTHSVNNTPTTGSNSKNAMMQTPKPNPNTPHFDSHKSLSKVNSPLSAQPVMGITPKKEDVGIMEANTPAQTLTKVATPSKTISTPTRPIDDEMNIPVDVTPKLLNMTTTKNNSPFREQEKQEHLHEELVEASPIIEQPNSELNKDVIEVREISNISSKATPRKLLEQEQARLLEIYQKQMSPRGVLNDIGDNNPHESQSTQNTNNEIERIGEEQSTDMPLTIDIDNQAPFIDNSIVEQVMLMKDTSPSQTPRRSIRASQSLSLSKTATPVPAMAVEEVMMIVEKEQSSVATPKTVRTNEAVDTNSTVKTEPTRSSKKGTPKRVSQVEVEEQQTVVDHEQEEQVSEVEISEKISKPVRRVAPRRGNKTVMEEVSTVDEPKTASKRIVSKNAKTPAKDPEEESRSTTTKSTGKKAKTIAEDDQPKTTTRSKRMTTNKSTKTPATKPSRTTQSTVKKAVAKSTQKAVPATAPNTRRSRRQLATKEEDSGADESVSPSLGAARRSKRNSEEAAINEESVPKRRSTRNAK